MADEEVALVTTKSRRSSSLSSSLSSSSSSLKGMLSSKIRLSALNYDTFDLCLSPDFTSSFEEHDYSEITTRAAALLGAEKCFLFIRDAQTLHTYIKDTTGKIVIATKPIDRGITGSVLSESTGCNLSKASQSDLWLEELDELPSFVTNCYLAWPIVDFSDGRSIGVVEFRNKMNGSSFFNAADSQFARIIALQLGHAIVNSKQQELIADHSEAIHQKCEAKNFDQGETINITAAERHPVRGFLKTEDVVKFIEKSKGRDVSFMLPSDCKDGDTDAASKDATGDTTHIPGIPSDATQSSTDVDVRRTSVISLNNSARQEADPELGRVFEEKSTPMRRLSLQSTVMQSSNILYTAMKRCLESPLFQALTFICTIFALFAFDFNLALGNKRTDPILDYATLSVLIIFVVEICLSLLCTKGYPKFFFWLDLIATTSLYFEISFFLESFENTGIGVGLNEFALARAGRAAKVGARAGRLLRLIRLLKIFKFATWTLKRVLKGDRRNDSKDDELEKDLTISMSIIGRRMTESITKKVILAVVLMLIVFSVTSVDSTPDARQLQLDSIAMYPNSTALRESFFRSHDNIVAFSNGAEYDIILDGERLDSLRDVEILSFVSDTDSAITASFDISQDTATQAILSIIITAFVSILLASMGLLFSRDAYQLVIHPIEKMKHTVVSLSENPLLHLERVKNHKGADSSETDVLEQAITKMAALLQVGFGSAGAEIIAKHLSSSGELNPMIPGVRVNAIFGFADIRNFTFATEGLQQDVLIFVNKIAAITHKHVVNSGGHPNKNIGDAFLLVWKLKGGKNGTNSSGDLQKDLYDSALAACQRVIRDIQHAGNLASFLDDDGGGNNMSTAWASSLRSYNVAIGVGLHKGWAIEGAIGSKVKIDASYLSPHVNMASRLEAATKQYRVPLLMSEAFFTGLSGHIQSTCRRVDRVIFKGSSDPMQIYHQDVEPLSNLTTPSSNHSDLVAMTSWDEDTENDYRGLIRDAQSKIESDNEMAHRDLFDSLMNAYLDKDWTMCKIYSHLWIKKWSGDRIVIALIEELSRHNFIYPDDWQYHKLTEK